MFPGLGGGSVRAGGRPFFYKTGHSLIKAKMKELNLLFAGEMSGHMFFADEYFGYDDALYAGARLLRLMSAKERPLSSLLSDVPRYYATPEIRIDIPEGSRHAIMDNIKQYFAKGPFEIIDVDGVRVNFEDGWGLLRLSNTQPVMVMRAEAKTDDGLEKISAVLKKVLDEAIQG
jgi:phosphomannomutase/phosphoglucomutase